MPDDPMEKIKPGDWVVWSSYRDSESPAFKLRLGDGPFQVSKIDSAGNISVYVDDPERHVLGMYYGPRFRKDIFVNAVKEAIASEGA